MNVHLAKARDTLLARPGRTGTRSPVLASARHQALELAYIDCGHGIDGPTLYLLVRYCPACLRGSVIDMVRELPEGIPEARQLELKQQRPWRTECMGGHDD